MSDPPKLCPDHAGIVATRRKHNGIAAPRTPEKALRQLAAEFARQHCDWWHTHDNETPIPRERPLP